MNKSKYSQTYDKIIHLSHMPNIKPSTAGDSPLRGTSTRNRKVVSATSYTASSEGSMACRRPYPRRSGAISLLVDTVDIQINGYRILSKSLVYI